VGVTTRSTPPTSPRPSSTVEGGLAGTTGHLEVDHKTSPSLYKKGPLPDGFF
jgi:hypothetical protein